ncbi:cyclic nucleotide-binding protein [Limnohabitans sp. 2KL-1]|jgi:CRP-like cAMP-binding protein|uniref:Crp/Fnr family transcriptional regulator n=1 Tax=Limnohabitans sp. 2KL-1 TaxID=1100699 RepID=UPI000D335035|nr:Crp/Fnr family transcriptional regulator [Limnohabitans sp. 2KL-1]PUE50922.1 cyclic nucleotide-binding protein [Limnohabitans sp. 2KL-1]
MIPIKIDSAWQGTSDCRSCAIRDMVLFADLNEQDFDEIHTPIDDMVFAADAALYTEGEKALGVFTLRKGMVKLVRATADGRERIVRVLRPGDVVGLEALANARYDSEAVALVEAHVCRIPLTVLHHLSANSPRLHKRLMQKWQQALKDADDWLADLNFGSARQRVAALALKMRDPDRPNITSFFARDDMGAMLDIKLETVSREISSLVRDGALKPCDKQGRRYEISNEGILLR